MNPRAVLSLTVKLVLVLAGSYFIVKHVSKEDWVSNSIKYLRPQAEALRGNTENNDDDRVETRNRLFECDDVRNALPLFSLRGKYWVFSNYITGSKSFACDESITVSTHGDYTFLDHLIPLLERWRGPISIALYAPGSDFEETVGRIHYLRECGKSSDLVKKFVTFHLFFDDEFYKKIKMKPVNFTSCKKHPNHIKKWNDWKKKTYRKKNKLFYPINVARNVAREMATTFFVLALDIELYPRPNLIQDFLKMLQEFPKYFPKRESHYPQGYLESASKNTSTTKRWGKQNTEPKTNTNTKSLSPPPQLFILPVFEVKDSVPLDGLPKVKGQLQNMYKKGLVFPFHTKFCLMCHPFPYQNAWLTEKKTLNKPLKVFYTTHRVGSWEPFFIGTKFDPPHDERLTWEGMANKMTQAYTFCLLNASYHILSNAFLVHHPGIKKVHPKGQKNRTVELNQKNFIRRKVFPQMKRFYGDRASERCSSWI